MSNHQDIMPTTSTNFALKMPPEWKEAAKALTKTYFDEPSIKGDGFINSIMLGSVNDAILYLMRNGLRETLAHIEKQIAEVTEEHRTFQELADFFMQNAAADSATLANFAEGSRARKYLDEMIEDDAEDENVDHAGEVSRAGAAHELAISQRQLYGLVGAKGAIQRALARGRQ
ncbi:hypothetical protein SAMN05444161_4733 [Rhizobiales bacterium GAS191]|nr:hypothetical protein SAMN05444161_4733 [Rhizobiales bacterium GAS191]